MRNLIKQVSVKFVGLTDTKSESMEANTFRVLFAITKYVLARKYTLLDKNNDCSPYISVPDKRERQNVFACTLLSFSPTHTRTDNDEKVVIKCRT